MPRPKKPTYAKLKYPSSLLSFKPDNYPEKVSTTDFGRRYVIGGYVLAMKAVDTDDRRVYVALRSIRQMRALAKTLTEMADKEEAKDHEQH